MICRTKLIYSIFFFFLYVFGCFGHVESKIVDAVCLWNELKQVVEVHTSEDTTVKGTCLLKAGSSNSAGPTC